MKLVKGIAKAVLQSSGFEIRKLPKNPKRIQPWQDDYHFRSLFDQVEDLTLVDDRRCFMLYQCALQADSLAGDVAEVGVYKGGTAKLLAKIFERSGKLVHVFDTFSGMPDVDPTRDLHQKGDFADVALEEVKTSLSDCANVSFHPGFFPVTAAGLDRSAFSLVHIDVDIYQSVMDCCQFFYARITEGGIIVFDDYGALSCPGAKTAVDEFFTGKLEHPIYLPTGQCVVIKQ